VALDAQTKMRQARAEKERRRNALAVSVVTALAERVALVLACEARAGAALRALTGAEGLTLREAVEWCGGEEQLSGREATRLRRGGTTATAPDEGSTAEVGEAGKDGELAPPVGVTGPGMSVARDGSGCGAAG